MVFARWADMTGGRVVFASPDQCTVESNVRAASTTGPPALGCGIIRRLQIGFGHVNPAGAVCAGNDPAYSLRHFQHTTSALALQKTAVSSWQASRRFGRKEKEKENRSIIYFGISMKCNSFLKRKTYKR